MNDTDTTPAVGQGWLKAAIRDPLTHFVVAGGLIFGAYAIFAPESPTAGGDPMQIELTADDMRQMELVWMSKGLPPPDSEQLQALAEQEAMQRVLVQEAFALGLDKDDEIINRRLAQKMDFLLTDLAGLVEPTDVELRTWYDANTNLFTLPPRLSFRHLYFAVDKRGEEGARADAAAALAALSGLPQDAPIPEGLADRFMFQDFYASRTLADVAKEFGGGYAEVVFGLEPGGWRGPVRSGYGWHLVWVSDLVPGQVAPFDEVVASVKAAWLDERYREIKERAFAEMLSRYTIVYPPMEPQDVKASQIEPEADDAAVVIK